jgi:tetratricopeptide (TPR) repeat protein
MNNALRNVELPGGAPQGGVDECIMEKLTCKRQSVLLIAAVCLAVALSALQAVGAETPTNTTAVDPEQYARTNYQRSLARLEAEPGNPDAAVAAGRACFELAEYAGKRAERASLAEEGVAACHRGLALRTNSGIAHYYLGMNLGQLARTRGWGALKMVGQLKNEFEAAAALDPSVDYGGPDRNLGYLYRDTPSFSIGDKNKALKHLENAVKLAPGYPENRLALIEGLLKWGERRRAREELKLLEESLPAARARFSGPQFATNWADWHQRLKEVQTKSQEHKKFLGIFGGDD